MQQSPYSSLRVVLFFILSWFVVMPAAMGRAEVRDVVSDNVQLSVANDGKRISASWLEKGDVWRTKLFDMNAEGKWTSRYLNLPAGTTPQRLAFDARRYTQIRTVERGGEKAVYIQ